MNTLQKSFDILLDLYYEKLEADGVDFIEYENIGNGQMESYVKDEYADPTLEEVLDYLDQPGWVRQWTKDLVKGDNNDK